MGSIPDLITIPHDDHHGRHVGKTASGRQFFITTPFTWLNGSREFVALYLFNAAGELIDAVIDDLGSRADLVGRTAAKVLPGNVPEGVPSVEERITRHLEYLGDHRFEDIRVKLFEVERHGEQFGLFPRLEEDAPAGRDPECLYVHLLPGDYMAFVPPWTGDYDT